MLELYAAPLGAVTTEDYQLARPDWDDYRRVQREWEAWQERIRRMAMTGDAR